MIQSLLPWSYSKLADYEKCPQFAAARNFGTLREPPSPAAARGTAIHEELERFLQNGKARVPSTFKQR